MPRRMGSLRPFAVESGLDTVELRILSRKGAGFDSAFACNDLGPLDSRGPFHSCPNACLRAGPHPWWGVAILLPATAHGAPAISFWNRGFFRSGAKPGSILSHPGER